MSKCQVCQERAAVVHLTRVENGTVSTAHLCSVCAGERGVSIESPLPLSKSPLNEILASIGGIATPSSGTDSDPPAICTGCGCSLADLGRRGRLGCSACWDCFAPELRKLLRRLHGASQHTGAWYQRPSGEVGALPTNSNPEAERVRIRAALEQAISDEAFEVAAQLRDALTSLDAGEPK